MDVFKEFIENFEESEFDEDEYEDFLEELKTLNNEDLFELSIICIDKYKPMILDDILDFEKLNNDDLGDLVIKINEAIKTNKKSRKKNKDEYDEKLHELLGLVEEFINESLDHKIKKKNRK